MRHRMKWMMLAVVVIVVSSVFADITPWNPDDPNYKGLRMNLHFQDNPTSTVTYPIVWYESPTNVETLKYHVLKGTLMDYNTTTWDVWQESGKMGISGDFKNENDQQPYFAPNDCYISLGPTSEGQSGYASILNFGSDTIKRTWTFWFADIDTNDPGDNKETQLGHIQQGLLDDSEFIRHENKDTIDAFWDIYMKNGRLFFRNNLNTARMLFSTVQDMNSVGILPWFGYPTVEYFTCNGGPNDVNFTTQKSPAYSSDDYKVYKRLLVDPCTETLLVEDTDYTIAPVAGLENYLRGARVTTPTPLASSYRLKIVREVEDQDALDRQWHHVVVVIDRTSETSSKIYIDGLVRAVEYGALPRGSASGNVNDYDNLSPMSIGGNGIILPVYPTPQMKAWWREGEFDGMMDEVRVYHKDLNDVEVSILYQTDGTVKPIALWPIPNSENVRISTQLEWIPAAGATAQDVSFDPNGRNVNVAGDGTMKKLTNAQMGGPLAINTTYFWDVNSTVGGSPLEGPGWRFKTITGKAACVAPANGATGIGTGRVNLRWSAPDATDFEVYFEGVKVANKGQVAIDSDPNWAVSVATPGKTYEWHVVSYYPYDLSADSDLWNFRAAPYPIVFNTSGSAVWYRYKGVDESIPAYTCMVNDANAPGWEVRATGFYDAGSGVAIFDFNDFIYNSYYDIIVIPEYTPSNDATAIPTPMIIDVNGDFYFGGIMNISGDGGDPDDRMLSPKARCGGHRGPRKEVTPGTPTDEIGLGYYKTRVEFESRLGDQRGHNFYPPTTSSTVGSANPSGAYGVFGLGTSMTAPYKDSGGAGHGGRGGCSGRGWIHGVMTYGYPYSDKEVPIPFGGSASSWAQTAPGNAGGGGVEIDAHKKLSKGGNVTLGPNAKILAEGGTTPYIPQYPAGGGSGGSVKIVADSNVVIDGLISVNGGDGADGSEKGNNTGGGGAGGRVAIFHGGGYTKNGTVTATGGDGGIIVGSGTYPHHNGLGLAYPGDDGTIYVKSYAEVSPRKASALTVTTPMTLTPWVDKGQGLVYCPNTPTALTLKWYSGYNVTPANDAVYCDTSYPPTTKIGNSVAATRGQHSSTTTKAINPGLTYYMQVRTSRVGITDVCSDPWSFKTVDWRCVDPNWPGGTYNPHGPDFNPDKPFTDPNRAGWPAYDDNHDCVINNLDWWPIASSWMVNRGGDEYVFDLGNLQQFVDEWMTCRARVKGGPVHVSGAPMCIGWPITPDFVPPGVTGAM